MPARLVHAGQFVVFVFVVNAVTAVASKFDLEVMQLLLSRDENNAITEDVVKAAARN